MKRKNYYVFFFMTVLFLLFLTGCSKSPEPKMANELHFALADISNVTISYDEEPITFYEADSDELIIKEYMTKDRRGYHANVEKSKDSIHISEGEKPFSKKGFSRYIEVYLPVSYTETLAITTTDGNIDLSDMNLHLSELRIDSSSGTVKLNKAIASNIHLSTSRGTLQLGSITADTISLDTTSGNITCDELVGNVTYNTTSGNADIKSAVGSGSYTASNSGKLCVVYTDVMGDLSLFNKNDDIKLMLPSDLEFEFEATTKNGSVSGPFQQGIPAGERTTRYTVGTNPTVTVKAETNNGNIEVSQ